MCKHKPCKPCAKYILRLLNGLYLPFSFGRHTDSGITRSSPEECHVKTSNNKLPDWWWTNADFMITCFPTVLWLFKSKYALLPLGLLQDAWRIVALPSTVLCELWSSKHIFKYSFSAGETQLYYDKLKLVYESTSKNAKGVDLSKRRHQVVTHSFYMHLRLRKNVFFNITWYLKRIWQKEVPSLHHLHCALGVQSRSKTFWFIPISEVVPRDDQKVQSGSYTILRYGVRELY